MYWTIIALGIILLILLAVAVLAAAHISRRRQIILKKQTGQYCQDFHQQRERLESQFVRLSGASGTPHGLRWAHIDFDDSTHFAQDLHTGQLRALVGITVGFEAIAGSDMEGVEAVGNLRAATAVFHFDSTGWNTHGRAIFNLEPLEAIRHLGHEMKAL